MSYPVLMVPAGDVIPILFATYAGSTGASVTMTGLAVTELARAFSMPCAATSTAVASTRAGVDVGVRAVVSVAAWAVRLSTLLCATRKARLPALDICAVRHGFKMGGQHAGGSSAKVVEIHPFRDRAMGEFVGEPMGANYLDAIPEAPVPKRGAPSNPEPTGISFLHFGPEAFLYRLGRPGESTSLGIVFHPVIVAGVSV